MEKSVVVVVVVVVVVTVARSVTERTDGENSSLNNGNCINSYISVGGDTGSDGDGVGGDVIVIYMVSSLDIDIIWVSGKGKGGRGMGLGYGRDQGEGEKLVWSFHCVSLPSFPSSPSPSSSFYSSAFLCD